MRHKKVKLIALLLLCIGLTGIQAQSSLYVRTHNGIQTSYALNSIEKLTFSGANMIVNKTSGSIDNYALNDIRYMNFDDLTNNISLISGDGSGNIILYPNPVIDQLQISYESTITGNIQVEILDIHGKVLCQQMIISQKGTNQAIIPVSQLSAGLYVCRLQSDDKIGIINFFKN